MLTVSLKQMLGLRVARSIWLHQPIARLAYRPLHNLYSQPLHSVPLCRRLSLASFRNYTPTPAPSPTTVAQISSLEAAADADPGHVDSQVKLFRHLIDTNTKTGFNVVMSRWERMCEFVRLHCFVNHAN